MGKWRKCWHYALKSKSLDWNPWADSGEIRRLHYRVIRMNVDHLLKVINTDPESIEFTEVISTIDQYFTYQPTLFKNGALVNEAGENESTCKILAFAKIHDLDKEHTLACFGHFYRDEVKDHLHDVGHPNIRTFLVCGWRGVEFQGDALTPR